MTQGFIDPQSDFADIVRRAAAHEWAKRAMDYAKAAGQSLDAASLDAWLDKAKQPEMKKLQEIDPDSYREQYDTAAGVAQELYMT